MGLRIPARALVDLDAIAANYRLLRARVAPRPVYAVVKADAYGHGATAVARRLAAEGADRFAVARDIDKDYAAAFDRARRRGVEMLAWRCAITVEGIDIAAPVPVLAG